MFSSRSISTLMVVGVVAAFAPQQTTNQCNIHSQSSPLPMQLNDEEEHNTRRNFLTKVVATAVTPILLTSTQASAAVGE